MPIVKIPVVQKFGIISTTYHLALQESLLKKIEDPGPKHAHSRLVKRGLVLHTLRDCLLQAVKWDLGLFHFPSIILVAAVMMPLEITEEFIKQFNNEEKPEAQERMLDAARKILHRCKRRSGLNSMGSGNHINLHGAWTELVLLTQCKGRIQDDALDILFVSMDHTTLNKDHIPLLFFIAESILYKICCDVVQKPYMSSTDVKLSKLGFLTFLRLYAFHVTGQLQPYEEQKERLSTYLEALKACEATYESYPNVLSSIHLMLKVGESVCSVKYPLETQIPLQVSELTLSSLTSWPWDIAYVYSMILANICLHGTTSEIQKHAFIGFQDNYSTLYRNKDASLNGLLFFNLPQTSENSNSIHWIIKYGAVYNLAKVCHELSWDESRNGLRNAIWKALHKQRSNEKDIRILNALKVAETEVNGPVNPFNITSTKASSTPVSLAFPQHAGSRLASELSQCFLPPLVSYMPALKKPSQKQPPIKLPEIKKHCIDKVSRLSLKQQLLLAEPCLPHPDFVTRTNIELKKVMEDQWEKELKVRIEEEEGILKREHIEKLKSEEEHFKEIMKKREQKLKKTSKPYEFPQTK
ncbi:transmembrane protein 232 [Rhinophrynus dorsalis]